MMRSLLLALILVTPTLSAAEPRMPSPGDCVVLREGGNGYILKEPAYYVKGTILELYRRPHRMTVCPTADKPRERFTRSDWQRYADAFPCVGVPELAKDVEAIRIRFRVDEWETPWAVNHGRSGMLFRGHFLNTELGAGVELDIDGALLQRCDVD